MIDRVLRQRSHTLAAAGILAGVAVSGGTAYATSAMTASEKLSAGRKGRLGHTEGETEVAA
jgi:hypothetical protein